MSYLINSMKVAVECTMRKLSTPEKELKGDVVGRVVMNIQFTGNS